MKTNEIIEVNSDSGKIKLSIDIIRGQIANDKTLTDNDIINFMYLCKYRKLNPFVGEAHLMKYGTKPQMIVSYHVFIKNLNRNPLCEGFRYGVIIQDMDKKIIEREGTFYLKDTEELVGAWCLIHRKGWKTEAKGTVNFSDYNRMYTDKHGNLKPMGLWATMPALMITKCAITYTIRNTFPEEFSGMYTSEEIGIDSNNPDIKSFNYQHLIDEKDNEKNQIIISSKQVEQLKEAAKSKDINVLKTYKPEELLSYMMGQLKKKGICNFEKLEKIPESKFINIKKTIESLVKSKEESFYKKTKDKDKKDVKNAYKSIEELEKDTEKEKIVEEAV